MIAHAGHGFPAELLALIVVGTFFLLRWAWKQARGWAAERKGRRGG